MKNKRVFVGEGETTEARLKQEDVLLSIITCYVLVGHIYTLYAMPHNSGGEA